MSNYFNFNMKGMNELEKAIRDKYEGAKAVKIINNAMYEGAEHFVEELKQNLGSFKDKGYEQDEVVLTKPKKVKDSSKVQVGWNGDHNRYALIHLNEFGYTKKGKQYTPRGFGVIAKTIKETENDYMSIVGDKLKELL